MNIPLPGVSFDTKRSATVVISTLSFGYLFSLLNLSGYDYL